MIISVCAGHPQPADPPRVCRAVLVGAVCLLGVLTFAWPARAHSVLQRSTPPPNTALPAAPPAIALTFSEPIVPGISTAVVVDRAGQSVARGAATAEGGRTITAAASNLSPGVYTVRWRVLSAVDGHSTSGFYVFAIGEEAPAGTGLGRTDLPNFFQVAARWIGLVAAMVVAGATFFTHLVVRPIVEAQADDAPAALVGAAELVRRRLTVPVALLLLATTAVEFVLRAVALFGASLRGVVASGGLWLFLTQTKAGWSMLLRVSAVGILLLPPSPRGRLLRTAAVIWLIVVAILVALLFNPTAVSGSGHLLHLVALILVATVYGLVSAVAALILPLVPDLRLPEGAWAPPVAGLLLLGGFTVSSHAAGVGPIAVLLDWIHLVAAAAWIGGLAALLVAVRSGAWSVAIVPRFSNVAAISLGLLVATGLYSAWVHVPALQAFTVTLYGRTLLTKLVLVVPLIVLGALNRFVFRPRLAAGGDGLALVRFVRSIGVEIILGVLVLLVVAVLTLVPPATVTMPAVAKAPLVLAGTAGEFRITLSLSPAAVGWNRYEVEVVDASGRPPAPDGRILLRVTKLDENLTPATVALTSLREGRYAAEGGELDLTGWWEVQVIVRQRGHLDRSTAFPVVLGDLPRRRSDQDALGLVREARAALQGLRSWRVVEQIANGSGAFVTTEYAVVRPDRLHYRTNTGLEGVIVGTGRYLREGTNPWRRDTLSQPLALEGPFLEYLTSDIVGAVLGREAVCDDEPCRVVLWEVPGRTAAFAGWVGLQTKRLREILMIAPSHYMTLRPVEYNPPLQISPP